MGTPEKKIEDTILRLAKKMEAKMDHAESEAQKTRILKRYERVIPPNLRKENR